ncbi:HlyD family efflux transporter periplasmic adaptor subunit [Litorisediminicola beolgyonensis]|uniref:HlyD family efflux transporter periplasmic adaptor subunit n=1 Tax=Litorisediminicola beolgyonensis TaxID=1173614 RepID=A0ABW3ZDT9_9RHOB
MTLSNDPRPPSAAARVSFLEQALWKALGSESSVVEFAKGWLGLQCRFLPGADGGAVVLAETPDRGPFSPAALWPDERALGPGLSAAVELALTERRPALKEQPSASGPAMAVAAHPIVIDGKLRGAAAIRFDPARAPAGADVLAHLRWGVGWLEARLRRADGEETRGTMARITAGYEVMAGALEQDRFKPACTALVTDLALRLDCEQVAVGFRGRGRATKVAAISHSAQFGKRMDLVRRIGFAMDEALDQEAAVLHPVGEDWEYRITHAHADLSDSLGGGTLLTVPLHRNGRMLGAITLQRRAGAPFDDDTIQLVDTVASLIGPVLEEKRQNDRLVISKLGSALMTQTKRLLGPGYFGRKLATLLMLAVVVFFSVVTAPYRVATPATLEGQVQRALVAPFDGFVASQSVKAGDVVEAGQILATLDDRDMVLERLQRGAELREHMAEYDRALNENERVEARVMRARIDETQAQIALLDARLARTELIAPFDGLVIEGDLSQAVGSGVRRGDPLFTIAPLEGYRVVMEVDEGDLREVAPGQEGMLVLSAIPDLGLPYVVERVTPIATAAEGRNYFRAEARLTGRDGRLRPGMDGVAKTAVDERLLIAIWSRELVDWVRLTAWKWLP